MIYCFIFTLIGNERGDRLSYTIENGTWRSVFAVPCDIVDLHLKLCGEVPLKVLLTLLRYNGGLDAAALSSIVGRPESVIREALEYLLEKGILKDPAAETSATLEYVEVPEPKPFPEPPSRSAPEKPAERKITAIPAGRRRFDRDEISDMAARDENIAGLLQEAQQVLGDTLKAAATETIVTLYTYYNMQPDLIMMVLQFCKSAGKLNMPYIEKVAASWVEKEITTHEQAEHEIRRLTQLHTNEGRVKSAFGLEGRALAAYEKKFIPVWFEDYGFDLPMIELAYERSIIAKGKLSFAYINGVLTKWHEKGIKKPAEAMREEPPKKPASAAVKSTSYDLGEIEALLNKGKL